MQDKSLGPKSIIGKLQTVQDNFQFAQHSPFPGLPCFSGLDIFIRKSSALHF